MLFNADKELKHNIYAQMKRDADDHIEKRLLEVNIKPFNLQRKDN